MHIVLEREDIQKLIKDHVEDTLGKDVTSIVVNDLTDSGGRFLSDGDSLNVSVRVEVE